MQAHDSNWSRLTICQRSFAMLGAILLLFAFGAMAYTDSFSSPPAMTNANTHMETGTATEGLVYDMAGGDFAWIGGEISALAYVVGPASFTITSRDGEEFLFYEMHIDTISAVTIHGYGTNAFSTSVPAGAIGDYGPKGAGKLVSSVVVSSSVDIDVTFDNVDVEFGDHAVPTLEAFERQVPLTENTNADTIIFRATFDEDVQHVTADDFAVSGTTATVSDVLAVNASTYDLAVSGGNLASYSGTVGINLAGAQDVADLVGNALPAGEPSIDETYQLDNTDPVDPTPSSSSHTVSVWDNDNTIDIAVAGASDTGGSGVDGFEIEWDKSAAWTPTETKEQEESWAGATFTATSDGDWYFHMATVDNAGNWTSTQHLGPFRIDTTPPSIPVGLDPVTGSYTMDTSPTLAWDASTDTGGSGIRTTGAYRIVVTGPVNRDTYVSDTDYNPTLSEGTFTWKVYARDNAGNSSSYSSDTTLNIDVTQPGVTVEQAVGQNDPTNTSPVRFTVIFDEPVNLETLDQMDAVIGGTATTGINWPEQIAPFDNTAFMLYIEVIADGTVTVEVPFGGIEDVAGNTNTASTSSDNEVLYDTTPPTIAMGAPSVTDTNSGPVTYTVTYGGADAVTLAEGDIMLNSTGTANGIVGVSVSGTTTRTVTISGITGDGTLGIYISNAGTGMDDAGNPAPEAGPSATFNVDNTPPSNPVVTSTHTAGVWSNNDYLGMNDLETSSDGFSGVDGYEYAFSQNATWTPSHVKDMEENVLDIYSHLPSDGDWYFHIATVDNVGNWAAHETYGPFRIDTTDPIDPTPTSTTHVVGVWSNDKDVVIRIDGDSDAGSGVDGFEVEWDKNATWTPTQTKDHEKTWAGATYTATSNGDWYFHIATADNAGNWTSTKHLGPFRIDTQKPSVMIDPSVGQADPTNGSLVLFTAVFDEPINELTFTNADVFVGGTAVTGTVTVAEVAPNDGTMFEISVAVTGEGTVIPTVSAGGVEDLAGNTNNASTSADNTVTVDMTRPVVHLVTVGDPVLTDGDTGLGLGVIFSEPMDMSVAPTLIFSPNVDTTLTPSSSYWLFDDHFYASFDVADADVDADSVTIDAIGARDVAGNLQTDYAPLHEFEIDMLNPTVVGVGISDETIDNADVGSIFMVTIDYSESMDNGVVPAIEFAPSVSSVLSPAAGAWVDSDTYQATYDVLDAVVSQVGIDITVTGAADAQGNLQQIAYKAANQFDIDILGPEVEASWIITPTGVIGAGVDGGGGAKGGEAEVVRGFLDRCLMLDLDGEQPMAGQCPLEAVYQVGEVVSGSCSICGPDGLAIRGTYVHIYIYCVDLEARPELRSLQAHWTVHYDVDTGLYRFDWETTGFDPGYYDIYLSFADGSAHSCRIQLIEPVD